MDFLSSGLFWLFFALTGVFMFIFEFGYSSRGILNGSLCQFFMTISGIALTIITILSFIFMWWQGGVAILVSGFIWMMITATVGNLLLRKFRSNELSSGLLAEGKMNWFQRHLNWTLVLAYLLWFVLNAGESVMAWLAAIFLLIVSGWVIKQKGRRLWWLLLFWVGSPLWLKNKKIYRELLVHTGSHIRGDELEQIPNEEEEKGRDKKSFIKAMSNEDLLALKEKYPNNESIAKLIDDILEARGKATKESQA